MRTWFYGIILAAMGLSAPNLLANTIYVNTTEDSLYADKCSLRQAITAANLRQNVAGCAAGGQQSIVRLPVGEFMLRPMAMEINSDITIIGSGAAQSIINADNRTNIFVVQENAKLTLWHVQLTQAKTTRFGAAISNLGGKLALYHSAITANLAAGNMAAGAGIFNYAGVVDLYHTELRANRVEYGYAGGGIFNYMGEINIIASNLHSNHANGFGGGAIYNSEGIINILNSSFIANRASFGGGLFNWEGIINLANTTFSANHAIFAGAIDSYGGEIYINHATIVNNTASYSGGIDNDGLLFLSNSIVLANQASIADDDCSNGSNSYIYSNGYNIFATDSVCATHDRDKLLDTDLSTVLVAELDNYVHALVADSVAIAAVPGGNCRYISHPYAPNPLFSNLDLVRQDQRGALRDYQTACDIGAVAANSPKNPVKPPAMPQTYSLRLQIVGEAEVSSHPTAISCQANQICYADFYAGTEVFLTAKAVSGHNLVAWEGDCAENPRQTRSLAVLVVPEEPLPVVNQTISLNLDGNKQCKLIVK